MSTTGMKPTIDLNTMSYMDPKTQQLTPEQSPYRINQAQDLLQQLQRLLIEGDIVGPEVIAQTLQKTEGLLAQLALRTDIDSKTRKILEDISMLIISARQMGRNKGFADRLQKIAEESKKAIEANRGVETPSAKEALDFLANWRPLFYLLVNSRDFRKLLLDAIKISRGIAYRYVFTDENEQKFMEGESAEKIATDVKEDVKEDVQNDDNGVMEDNEWERLQEDIQSVLAVLSREPTYREGIERIFTLLDMFQNSLSDIPTSKSDLTHEIHMRRAVQETEELVVSFSGRETFDQFKFHLKNLIHSIKEDERLYGYLNELKNFILKAKSEEEVQSQEFKDQSKELAKRGRSLMKELKEDDLKPLLQAANDMIENIKNDEFLRDLRHQAGIVQSDLSYIDSEGLVQVDTDILGKLQSVLLPTLAEALKYIPVPRIYSSNSKREFWLDNIVLCSYDIIPENIRFHLETDSEISLRDVELKGTRTRLVIQLNRLLAEVKNVEFYYHRKTFPEIEDSGRVTFRETGVGSRLTLTYNILQTPEDKVPRIMEGHVDFDISNLQIEFDTNTLKHDVIIPMLTNMFKLQIQQQIEYEVEKNLKGFLDKFRDMLTSAIGQTNRPFMSGFEAARNAIKNSPLAQIHEQRKQKLE
jgi:hypothetical protein